MPLEWFYGSGVVLDVRHLASNAAATSDDFREALARIPYSLQPHDIVLVQTGQ